MKLSASFDFHFPTNSPKGFFFSVTLDGSNFFGGLGRYSESNQTFKAVSLGSRYGSAPN